MTAIELATSDDVPEILALANWAAENTSANFATGPEPLEEWAATFREMHTRYPWLVARQHGRVVGFAKGSMHRARGAYRFMAEVSVYIHPDHHRQGLGRKLYGQLIPTMRAQGYVTLLAGITPPNPGSEGLHAAMGFVRCGTYHRAGWKFDRWHDVGYWEMHLQRADLPPGDLRPVGEVWPKVQRWAAGGLELRSIALKSPDASALISSLNGELAAMYPEPGANHFRLEEEEVGADRGAFVAAYLDGEAVGCGAVRKLDAESAELKRMYVQPRWRGLGISKKVLVALEAHARRLGVARMLLETGIRQVEAIPLYEKSGYRRIAPFGEYVNSPLTSVCMEKRLS